MISTDVRSTRPGLQMQQNISLLLGHGLGTGHWLAADHAATARSPVPQEDTCNLEFAPSFMQPYQFCQPYIEDALLTRQVGSGCVQRTAQGPRRALTQTCNSVHVRHFSLWRGVKTLACTSKASHFLQRPSGHHHLPTIIVNYFESHRLLPAEPWRSRWRSKAFRSPAKPVSFNKTLAADTSKQASCGSM